MSIIVDLCKDLSTLTFSKNKELMFKGLRSGALRDPEVIVIGDYVFRKIAYNYRPMTQDREMITKAVITSLSKVPNPVLRATYIHYLNDDAQKDICLHFYHERHPDEFFLIQMLNDQRLIHIYDVHELREHFIKWITADITFEQKSNLLDVVLREFPFDKEILEIRKRMEGGENVSLYQNQQNAHNEKLMKSTLVKAYALLEDMAPTRAEYKVEELNNLVEECIKKWCEQKSADLVITRYRIDPTSFPGQKGDNFRIFDLFVGCILYILSAPPEFQDLLRQRFSEEVVEMAGLCATGYIERLMNIFKGVVEKYEVTLDFGEQVYSLLADIVIREIRNAPEDVIAGTYEEEFKGKYEAFIKATALKYADQWKAQYSLDSIDAELQYAVNRYLGRDESTPLERDESSNEEQSDREHSSSAEEVETPLAQEQTEETETEPEPLSAEE